jgi:hypothetical protein
MNRDNILGNLVASAIWSLVWIGLCWAALRLRTRLKKAVADRKRTAALFQITHEIIDPEWDKSARQDLMLLAELTTNRSRRLLGESQFFTLLCVVALSTAVLIGLMYPKDIFAQVFCGIMIFPLVLSLFINSWYSKEVEAFENGVLQGLTNRLQRAKEDNAKQATVSSEQKNATTSGKVLIEKQTPV